MQLKFCCKNLVVAAKPFNAIAKLPSERRSQMRNCKFSAVSKLQLQICIEFAAQTILLVVYSINEYNYKHGYYNDL